MSTLEEITGLNTDQSLIPSGHDVVAGLLPDIIDWGDDIDGQYTSPLSTINPELDGILDTLTDDGNMQEIRLLKETIASNYDLAAGITEETWRTIVAIRNLLGSNAHHADKPLLTKSTGTLEKLLIQMGKFSEIIESAEEKDRKKVAWNLGFVMVPFADAYDDELFGEPTVDTIIEHAKHGAYDLGAADNLGLAIRIIQKSSDPSCLPAYIDYYSEIESGPNNQIDTRRARTYILRAYFMSHGLDEQRVEGFRNNIFPLMEQQDKEVVNVGATNSWPREYGGFGISDFTIHCLISTVNPKNLRDLIQAYREIPTSDFAKFEQNRKDAAELVGTLWRGRDWIHDEVTGVHSVLAAMLDYYESRGDPDVHQEKQAAILEAVSKIPADYRPMLGSFCFDLENYEKPVKKLFGETYSSSITSEDTEPAIDVLRRLVENTRQTTLEKPHTEDEQLNNLLEHLQVKPNELTGEVHVSLRQVGQLVSYANQILISRQGEIGLRPSMVQALAYIEKMATYAMRGISDRDWQELPYDPNFKEIVKFRDLTCGPDNFDESSFEAFWQSFARIPDWPKGVQDSYKKLSHHILDQINKMAKQYNSNPYTSYMSDSLWSGNLNHELIGLTDTRQSFRRYEGLD